MDNFAHPGLWAHNISQKKDSRLEDVSSYECETPCFGVNLAQFRRLILTCASTYWPNPVLGDMGQSMVRAINVGLVSMANFQFSGIRRSTPGRAIPSPQVR